MKKFFLIAAAAVVAFASCSKNESAPEQAQDKAIGFNTYTGRAVTKADTTFIPKGQTYLNTNAVFGVYAYNTEATPFAGSVEGAKKFMVNEKVTFSGSTSTDATNYEKYSYDNKKYWPNDEANNLLTFWAYAPYNALTGGFGANEFEAGTDPTKMVDLLLSDVKEDMTYTKATKKDNVGIVPFTFHHALTMVQFYVKADKDYEGATITLNELTVKGAYSKGQVTTSFGPAEEDDDNTTNNADAPANVTSFKWAIPEGVAPAVFEVCAGDANIDKTGSYFPLIVAEETTGQDAEAEQNPYAHVYLMIPQDLTNVKAEIKYTVTSSDQNVDPVINTVTVDLATTAVPAWVMNKNILYTFTIGLKPIEFTAVVTDWDTLQNVDFVIPPVTNSDDNSGDNNDNPTTVNGN